MCGADMFRVVSGLLFFIVNNGVLKANEAHGGGHDSGPLNYYKYIGEALGLHGHTWDATLAAILSLIILTVVGLVFKKYVASLDSKGSPTGKPSLGMLIENFVELAYGICKDTIGHGYKIFLPLVTGIFFYILTNNLMGLVPGFPPATESINTNLAVGLIVFLTYNLAGLKEHGIGYLKHFLGPLLAIAPVMLIIELISHSARPLSLSIRLMANLFADHLMLSIFTEKTKLLLPALFMFFGLLVCFIQTFVFTLLTSIYISMAVAHDH